MPCTRFNSNTQTNPDYAKQKQICNYRWQSSRFDDWKYTVSKDKAEKVACKLASENPNTQVDLCEWNEGTNGWDYVSGYMTCQFG